MSESQQKILIAILAAFLGFALGWLKDFKDRRDRRRALASIVLYDLAAAEDSLRDLFSDTTPANAVVSTTEYLGNLLSKELLLFKPAAVASLLAVYGNLRAIRDIQTEFAAGRMPSEDRAHWLVQMHAREAAAGILLAAVALEAEGGKGPVPSHQRLYEYPELPPIPGRHFEVTSTANDALPPASE